MTRRTTLCAFAALFLATTPDEGQWLPQQVLAMDWDALRARGMKLSKDEFWHPTKGGVLSAAVQINGCTASFCSKDGLVVTNHHCGYGAVNALSSPESNYLREGFVAKTKDKELPAPGVTVYVVRRIENVTDRILAAQARARTDIDRFRITESIKRQLIQEGEKEPNTTCSIADFFEGREYHMYYRTQLPDVRLVYAPPSAIGEFGGEVDNWEWPRHTGDFCFFRAYAAPDGSPRAYNEENVPFQPEHYLRVSSNGVQEGDLAMILGYPGRTERYETSIAVQDRQGFYYPKRLDLFTRVIDVLKRARKKDVETDLRYASKQKSLANVQKNAEGMVWGLARNAVVARKLREESEFEAWVSASSERQTHYAGVLDDLKSIDLAARETQEKDLVGGLMGSQFICPIMAGVITMAANAGRDVTPRLAKFLGESLNQDLDLVQKPIMRIMLEEAAHLPDDQRLAGTESLRDASDVERIMADTEMFDANARLALAKGGADAMAASTDPLIVVARGLAEERQKRATRQQERAGRRIAVGTRWIEAQQKWRGSTFYPDANSTLRVSIASVKGYEPRDGVSYTPHTTVAGILAKETGAEPFASPSKLIEAAQDRFDSRYFDWRIGDVPVCFLTDGDTTGGNSGSPVINGKGELVGLNFDRVFENVSGDYGWNADRSRNISVDIRYVLWVLEQVQPAHHLLREMQVM